MDVGDGGGDADVVFSAYVFGGRDGGFGVYLSYFDGEGFDGGAGVGDASIVAVCVAVEAYGADRSAVRVEVFARDTVCCGLSEVIEFDAFARVVLTFGFYGFGY